MIAKQYHRHKLPANRRRQQPRRCPNLLFSFVSCVQTFCRIRRLIGFPIGRLRLVKFICLVPPFPRCEAKGKFASIDGPHQRKISDKALTKTVLALGFITIKVRLNIWRLCFSHVSQQSSILTIIGEVEDVRIMAQFHTCSTSSVLRSGYSLIIRRFQSGYGVSAARPSDSVVC